MNNLERLVKGKKGEHIRQMFNRIAQRYDLANHFLSFGVDRAWRSRTRAELSILFPSHSPLILDVCCGTGDLSFELSGLGPVIGLDFAHAMLRMGRQKLNHRVGAIHNIQFLEGDGMTLPFRDESFDIVTAAFGVRNFENLGIGLREMIRVLRPKGVVAILEFSKPRLAGFSALYNLYFNRVLPFLGGMLTGHSEPYRYLPASVQRFSEPGELGRRLSREGLVNPRVIALTFGVASLCLARKE